MVLGGGLILQKLLTLHRSVVDSLENEGSLLQSYPIYVIYIYIYIGYPFCNSLLTNPPEEAEAEKSR